ncbi:putative Lachesin [Operophtera brumata]|uniref:Putative Lachesin n=1 Tax=Operophtera brumata TaxID=104452 RepID=A0A0L7KX44_OPEBR|nr:putative Lachesin [Operophtera brumata]
MTSTDMVVREGTNVTMVCRATGYPEPYVMWRREDGQEFNCNGESVNVVDGENLTISKVSRLHMGAYLCIASNGTFLYAWERNCHFCFSHLTVKPTIQYTHRDPSPEPYPFLDKSVIVHTLHKRRAATQPRTAPRLQMTSAAPSREPRTEPRTNTFTRRFVSELVASDKSGGWARL